MNPGWIVLGVCVAWVVSGTLPLLRERARSKGSPPELPPASGRVAPHPQRPPLPPSGQDTLRDWRSEARHNAPRAARRQASETASPPPV